MRQVDTLLASFPGPVTLTPSRRSFFVTFVVCAGFAVFCGYLLISGRPFGWYDTMMAVLAMALFGVCGIMALALLLIPSAASLTLDDSGFEISGIFRRVRASWWDVSGFRVEAGDNAAKEPTITYELRTAGTGSQRGGAATKTTRTLPRSYGLPADDLAWLMNEWRQRALAQRVVRLH